MKHLLSIACAVMACAVQAAAGRSAAASQAWVSNYVAQAIAGINTTTATTNGIGVIAAGDVVITMEPSSDAALLAQASIIPAITNGTTFVWNGRGAYINPAGIVTCTATNMVYCGVASVYTNGVLRFAGNFDAKAIRIQPSTSFSITNGMQEVGQ